VCIQRLKTGALYQRLDLHKAAHALVHLDRSSLAIFFNPHFLALDPEGDDLLNPESLHY
jgi:hypothetical protein